MPLIYIRVVNEQVIDRSLLIDKIDKSQGNFEGYAQRAKQAVYIPYVNPDDTSVKGYLNLVPTDEVLLAANNGSIKGLSDANYITFSPVDALAIAKSVVVAAANDVMNNWTDVDGLTFTSVYPDDTRLQLKNMGGTVQTITSGDFAVFTGIAIRVLDAVVTIGVPAAGWQVRVQANSLFSEWFTL